MDRPGLCWTVLVLSSLIMLTRAKASYSVISLGPTSPFAGRISYSYTRAHEKLAHHESCEKYFHWMYYYSKDRECSKRVGIYSCRGQCTSESHPKMFYAASNESYVQYLVDLLLNVLKYYFGVL